MSRTGLEGVHGGTGFAGFGLWTGGFLGVEEVGEELGLGEGRLVGGVFVLGFRRFGRTWSALFRALEMGSLIEIYQLRIAGLAGVVGDVFEKAGNIVSCSQCIAICNISLLVDDAAVEPMGGPRRGDERAQREFRFPDCGSSQCRKPIASA